LVHFQQFVLENCAVADTEKSEACAIFFSEAAEVAQNALCLLTELQL
jgi:hypothetical protein